MSDEVAFEERVSAVLDALYDGAELLAEGTSRAEALVIAVVVEAAREPTWPEAPEAFRSWILARLVQHYLDYATAFEGSDGRPDGDAVPTADRSEDPGAIAMADLVERLDREEPERLTETIRRCMRELPVRERAALWLVNVMEFPYAEAAAALEVRFRELRDLLYRARGEMRFRLALALRPRSGSGGAASGGTASGPDGGVG